MSLHLRNPFNLLRRHAIALDAGSGRTLITTPLAEILLDEPTVIAIEQGSGNVIATGTEAKSYLGKAPERIQVIRPIQAGVIVDFDSVKALMRHFFKTIAPDDGTRLHVSAVVSQGLSALETQTFRNCLKQAGASRVDLINAPLAAAIGSGLDIRQPKGRLLLGIGAGLAEAAVLYLSDVVQFEAGRCGAELFHEHVAHHLAARYQVAIGENMAEQATVQLAWADRPEEKRSMTLTGKYAATGTPCALELTDDDLEGALDSSLDALEALVRSVMDKTPAALVADIADTGLILHGGGAQVYGLEQALGQRLGLRTRVVPEPAMAAVRGAAATLRPDLDYKQFLVR
ncbi:MAG: rod shape-determining protein [Proteobacteria bacterium]|nr:rod shape-determining protein [Pseudomonadota bacterium]MBU1594581.1 rod shape-determining protein [Pseudomonadota bacterium]